MAVGGQMLRARIGSQRLVLIAAFVTIMVAATALTGLAVYLRAAATGAVQESLAAQPTAATGVTITATSHDPTQLTAADAAVRRDLDGVFTTLPHEIALRLETSTTYTLPIKAADGGDTITTFVWREDLLKHATLTSGAWPAPAGSGDTVQVALSDGAAAVMGMGAGDEFDVVQRIDDAVVHVTVAGTYNPEAPDDWYWRSDALDTIGTYTSATYPVIGPLLVADMDTLTGALSTTGFANSWRVGVDWADATLPVMDATRDRIVTFAATAGGASGRYGPNVRIESGLTTLLPSLSQSLTASQSMMVIPILQLALLAACTLFLAARLLADHRRDESALLQARGASRGQSVWLAIRETALLVLPAAVLAPVLAWGVLRLASGHGPFDTLVGHIPNPAVWWWVVSVTAALLCGLSLVLPSLRRSRSYVEAQSERGRESRRGMIQRAGVDVLLLAAAAVAYWQLRHYTSPVISGQSGTRIDPLLVLGPCLALFAAAALALRLLPLVARVGQVLAARGQRLAAALGTWQVSRRPLRYSGPALLLVLALAIGALSAAHASSWLRSQDDQATFAAGADVRVTAATAFGSVPAAGQGSVVGTAPGVTAAMAVTESTATVADKRVAVLGLDSRNLADVARARTDLVPAGLPALQAALTDAFPAPSPLTISDAARTLGITATGTIPPGSFFVDPRTLIEVADDPTWTTGSVALALMDAHGTTFTTPSASFAFDGQPHALTFDLTEVAGATIDEHATVAFPLQVIGAIVESPFVGLRTTLSDGETVIGPSAAFAMLDDLRAGDTAIAPAGSISWSATQVTSLPGSTAPTVTTDDALASITMPMGQAGEGHRVRISTQSDVTTIPIVMDAAASEATGAGVGDTATVRADGVDITGRVAAIVKAFPGTDPENGAILVDLTTLATHRWVVNGAMTSASSWWLSTTEPAATAAGLDRQPRIAARTVAASELAKSMKSDPLGQATLGAMFAGFIAALAFAGVGFVTNLIIGARERLSEFAVLRALGVSRFQVLTLLLVEQAFLVGLGVVVGFAVGIGVAFLVIPYVILSAQALRTLPPVIVNVPWLSIGLIAAGTVAVLGLAVAVSANRLQRQGLGGALRIGEDR